MKGTVFAIALGYWLGQFAVSEIDPLYMSAQAATTAPALHGQASIAARVALRTPRATPTPPPNYTPPEPLAPEGSIRTAELLAAVGANP